MSFCILKQPRGLRGAAGPDTPPRLRPPQQWGPPNARDAKPGGARSGLALALSGARKDPDLGEGTDLTLTMSAGVPTNPPMQPGRQTPEPTGDWRRPRGHAREPPTRPATHH